MTGLVVELLVLLALAALFTPTYVVLWQLWTSRLGAQRRDLPPPPVRRVVVPAPRQSSG